MKKYILPVVLFLLSAALMLPTLPAGAAAQSDTAAGKRYSSFYEFAASGEWRTSALSGVVAEINTNFFSEDDISTGVTVKVFTVYMPDISEDKCDYVRSFFRETEHERVIFSDSYNGKPVKHTYAGLADAANKLIDEIAARDRTVSLTYDGKTFTMPDGYVSVSGCESLIRISVSPGNTPDAEKNRDLSFKDYVKTYTAPYTAEDLRSDSVAGLYNGIDLLIEKTDFVFLLSSFELYDDGNCIQMHFPVYHPVPDNNGGDGTFHAVVVNHREWLLLAALLGTVMLAALCGTVLRRRRVADTGAGTVEVGERLTESVILEEIRRGAKAPDNSLERKIKDKTGLFNH